jgi:hypothetical protein
MTTYEQVIVNDTFRIYRISSPENSLLKYDRLYINSIIDKFQGLGEDQYNELKKQCHGIINVTKIEMIEYPVIVKHNNEIIWRDRFVYCPDCLYTTGICYDGDKFQNNPNLKDVESYNKINKLISLYGKIYVYYDLEKDYALDGRFYKQAEKEFAEITHQ